MGADPRGVTRSRYTAAMRLLRSLRVVQGLGRALAVSASLVGVAGVSACTVSGSDDGGSTGGSGESSATTTASTSSTAESSTSGNAESSSTGGSSSGGADSSGGSSSESGSSSGTESTGAVEFALMSTAYAEGEGMPHECHAAGGNQSPPLSWVGTPGGTQSFGLFFHDITIDFDHSAIWNISADTTELPQDIDHDTMPADVPGAVQCENWLGDFGYGGPGSASNFYEFRLYALDVADLSGEIDENSALGDVFAAFEAHSLGVATLTGQSTGP